MAKYLKCDSCEVFKQEDSWGLPPIGWTEFWCYAKSSVREKHQFCSITCLVKWLTDNGHVNGK